MSFGSLLVVVFAITMTAVYANSSSFSLEDQAIWIDRFNSFRTRGLPWSAGNMRRIGWNSDLATSATSTAAECSATTAPGVNVYQSLSTNNSSLSVIDAAIQQWVVETSMTTLPKLEQPGASGVDIGKGTYNSYSQVLWAATTSVGCASASCPGGAMVVCEFSPAGNDRASAWYVHADTASKCPSGTTAFQGLCIVEGDDANNQIAPIPAGRLTYEVFPAYVANMQTVLIEAARSIANGQTQTAPMVPTTAASPSMLSETSSISSMKGGSDAKFSGTERTPSSSMSDFFSSNSKASSPVENTGKTLTLTSKKTDTTTTSPSGTDPSSETSIKPKPPPPKILPGTVKAGSSIGSTFLNQETSTKQPLQRASATSTDSGEVATASAPAGISVAGIAGMIVIALVGVAAFGVILSYKKNQRRQREIMRDGGIRTI